MDINKLKTFVDLARTLSFSATAVDLYTEQSTVSKHIHSLEKELGVRLFDRNNRHVYLSAFGKAILPVAQQIVDLNGQMIDKAHAFQDQQSHAINLGVIPTFADHSIFQTTMAYQGQHPAVQLNLHEMETNDLLDRLNQGQIDLAFMRTIKPSLTNYDQLPVGQEQFTVALPSDHPLAEQATVRLIDLRNEKFIMLSKKSLLYNPVVSLCQKVGFDPDIFFVSDRISTILKMVGSHQGIAILMHTPERVGKVIFKKLTPTLTSYLMFVRRPNLRSKIVDDLWHYLQQEKQ